MLLDYLNPVVSHSLLSKRQRMHTELPTTLAFRYRDSFYIMSYVASAGTLESGERSWVTQVRSPYGEISAMGGRRNSK